MKLSASMLTFLKNIEKCFLTPYWDVKGWSVGYGHFLGGTKDKKPGNISQAQADAWLLSDVAAAESKVNTFIAKNPGVPMPQSRFDALVDFGYNLGIGSLGNVLDTLKTNDDARVKSQMLSYNKIRKDGVLVVSDSLSKRRQYEVDLMQLNPIGEKKNSSEMRSDMIIEITVVILFIFLLILYFKFKRN